ncbi:MAG: molybdopterin-binding protein [Planctomycetales bacterium]|nr:molybdopterin-binding protein [Planctomycetales bacterium]
MSHEEHRSAAPTTLRCAVLTLSDSRTEATDSSGKILRDALAAAGHSVADYRVIREDPGELRLAVLSIAEKGGVDALLVNGGTGISPRDGTFEELEGLLEKRLEGFGEIFRALSFAEIGPAAMLTRATAGIFRGMVVASVPGSPHAVRLAWERLLAPELPHMVSVARGPNPRPAPAGPAPGRKPARLVPGSSRHLGPEEAEELGTAPTLAPVAAIRPWSVRGLAEVAVHEEGGARIRRLLEGPEMAALGADHVVLAARGAFVPEATSRSETLLFLLKGSATFEADGKSRAVKAGDVVHVAPTVEFRLAAGDGGCDLLCLRSPR